MWWAGEGCERAGRDEGKLRRDERVLGRDGMYVLGRDEVSWGEMRWAGER